MPQDVYSSIHMSTEWAGHIDQMNNFDWIMLESPLAVNVR